MITVTKKRFSSRTARLPYLSRLDSVGLTSRLLILYRDDFVLLVDQIDEANCSRDTYDHRCRIDRSFSLVQLFLSFDQISLLPF